FAFSRLARRMLKSVRREIVYVAFRTTHFPLRIAPLSLGAPFAKVLGALGYFGFRKLRRRALRQAETSLGAELPKDQLRALVRRSFEHYARLYFEFINSDRYIAARPDLFDVIGLENLDRALQRGRGVVWISGHLGNWEMMATWLSFLAGYKLNIATRSLRDSRLNEVLFNRRLASGMNQIPRDSPNGFKEIIGALSRNEIMGIMMDQDVDVRGVFADFFGRPAFTPSAAAALALKLDAAVVGGFTARLPDGRHRVTITAPVEIVRTGDYEHDVRENTSRFNLLIEEAVRRNPDQWVWIHRRWKTKPTDRVKRQESGQNP
ncbi:MAG: lysophospholipid acyltransferase family protein, partial [Vicinamibacteria bacterium]